MAAGESLSCCPHDLGPDGVCVDHEPNLTAAGQQKRDAAKRMAKDNAELRYGPIRSRDAICC